MIVNNPKQFFGSSTAIEIVAKETIAQQLLRWATVWPQWPKSGEALLWGALGPDWVSI